MKQEYKRPLLFIASLFTAFCAVYFGGRLIGFYMTEYPKWNGQSADGNWEAVIKKIEGRALFGGDLYWTGDRGELDDIYLEKLVVRFGDEIVLNTQVETPMRDYAGGEFPGGGSKEQSVSFLEGLEEAEFAGRKVTVQLDWRKGKQASHTAFTLDKSSW
ncbi:DUF4944 domain-containing protein [Bacillus paralicheniformis]|uniref:DUF4944 domain-containing protein n=1 Tax=Bacillus TaxID=1386 RepID=UPI0003A49AE9|nr:DUF4944 domain-containing protein [Bacillus paralicheniformis]MSN99297.1 DUF4944 domain-containing protein [Bacillus paralicheniformis]MSO03305.1 DUF4944 domain-containing protein [Bacillus paralicheniformis]MSO07298.1 DUF4944 domain-containing protein [Bacillus paralicheniformis]MSO11292.1 DUF4944 domain-containing protein [Bacillus paralicheniformis]NJE36687.1 DUF4944 domain-containing protein [Bacillus paralicheniformis]